MPEVEVCRFAALITDEAGRTLGEAQVWGAGTRGGAGWTGWLRPISLDALPPPGRYTAVTADGWSAIFEVLPAPGVRVFDRDLAPIAADGDLPWPPVTTSEWTTGRQPPATGTPWQGSRGIPPYKQQGDNPPRTATPPRRSQVQPDQADESGGGSAGNDRLP